MFPSPDDFWSDFQRIAWHQDMPFGALSFYAQWRVMRAASEAGVKVLIDGQGGDEVFGGYAKFRYAYLASLLRSGRFGTAARELTGMLRQGDRYVLDIRNGYRYLPPFMRRALNIDSALQHIVTGDWNAAVADESTPADALVAQCPAERQWLAVARLLQRIQMDDIGVDTLPQLLRMEDRSSMAFSLEARVPLLDHHVVELGLSLPDHLKVNNGWSKFAVRQAMAGWSRTRSGCARPNSDSPLPIARGWPATSAVPLPACSAASCAAGDMWMSLRCGAGMAPPTREAPTPNHFSGCSGFFRSRCGCARLRCSDQQTDASK